MSFDVPTDLIRQVQAALRKDAGLSSYNPYDPAVPPLPSFPAAIAGLDPSPPSLRCNHCDGRLLCGMQSLICVYCGKQRKRDVPPEPIAFNSTYGYRLLLESLGLDGSETIGPDIEEIETNRGQSIPKDEISLSKLLDLHIPWLDEPGKIETGVTDKNLQQNESLVTLTGVDLVNYLQEPNTNIVFNAFQDQPVTTNQIESSESKEVTGQDNLNLFQNIPEDSGDDLSGWEASFQSADNHHESSKSADPFISSPVDLTAHINSVFGGGENFHDVKPNDDPVPATSISNWTEDDLFNNAVSQPLDSASKDVNDQSSDNVDWFQDNQWQSQNNIVNAAVDKEVNSATSQPFDSDVNSLTLTKPSSESVDWFDDNQWQTNITSVPNDKAVNENEDSFDEWNDFTTSSNPQAPLSSDINMFGSPSNFQEVGSFFPEGSNSERNGDSKSNAVENFDTILKPKDDVEILISQMHDLSFMLDNNLSIPQKLEAVGSFSHD